MRAPAEIRIQEDSSEPVVRQIVVQVRTLIVEGVLRPGDALPSVRRLATDLAVHFNTVAEAYRTLADEGWLDVSHGRGARVVERQMPAATADTVSSFRVRLRHMVAEMRAAGLTPARIRTELKLLMEVLK